METYCQLCETEATATATATWLDGATTNLCETCYEAFNLGRAYAEELAAADTPGAHDDYSQLVPDGWECPDCHEARMDHLLWDEDGEVITCDTCGTSYTIADTPTEDEDEQHDPRNADGVLLSLLPDAEDDRHPADWERDGDPDQEATR